MVTQDARLGVSASDAQPTVEPLDIPETPRSRSSKNRVQYVEPTDEGNGDDETCVENCDDEGTDEEETNDEEEPATDVPEFGTIAAAAVLAFVGLFVYRNRKN